MPIEFNSVSSYSTPPFRERRNPNGSALGVKGTIWCLCEPLLSSLFVLFLFCARRSIAPLRCGKEQNAIYCTLKQLHGIGALQMHVYCIRSAKRKGERRANLHSDRDRPMRCISLMKTFTRIISGGRRVDAPRPGEPFSGKRFSERINCFN